MNFLTTFDTAFLPGRITPSVNVAFLATYPPYQCGVANFTADLIKSIIANSHDFSPQVIAVEDSLLSDQNYPTLVKQVVTRNKRSSYFKTADFLNRSDANLLCLQYKPALYGGNAGDWVLDLVANVNIPVVTVIHEVQPRPDETHCRVIQALARNSQKIVVLSNTAYSLLKHCYGVDRAKIEMIPHGVPDVPFDAGKKYKYELGLNENTILTTFGLLHRGKGIEFIIKAMPELVKKHPELILLVLGTTHPHIRKLEGEAYHKSLQELVRRLNLEKHVCFKNRFLEPAELDRYLSATDIYISPFLGQEQTVSATLSYALGYGKAIISTPYLFAQEVLSQSRGLLVEVQDSNSIYEAIIKYLDEPGFMNRVRQAAYTYGHKMAWKNIGLAYSELFKTVLNSGSDFNNFSENPESGLRLV